MAWLSVLTQAVFSSAVGLQSIVQPIIYNWLSDFCFCKFHCLLLCNALCVTTALSDSDDKYVFINVLNIPLLKDFKALTIHINFRRSRGRFVAFSQSEDRARHIVNIGASLWLRPCPSPKLQYVLWLHCIQAHWGECRWKIGVSTCLTIIFLFVELRCKVVNLYKLPPAWIWRINLTHNADVLGCWKLLHYQTPSNLHWKYVRMTSRHLTHPWEKYKTRQLRNAKYITNSCI